MYIILQNDFHEFKLKIFFWKNHQWTSLTFWRARLAAALYLLSICKTTCNGLEIDKKKEYSTCISIYQ